MDNLIAYLQLRFNFMKKITMYLAQVNIAKMKAPIDDPVMQDFVDNLDSINALAEDSDGFIWRLKADGNNAT
jgi:hypothetical protein